MTKDALLEIGSEELPASFVPLGMRQLKALAEASLAEHKLGFGTIAVYGTPRRLAVVLTGLADRSQDQSRVVSGPPARIAKDAQGQWTPAAIGFAKKQGLSPDQLTLQDDKWCAVLQMKGVPTKLLLAQLFPEWIRKLEFPKSMVWEPSQFRFARPIRWVAALYGHEGISFAVAGVRASKWTYGLRLQSGKKIALPQPAKYPLILKNQCVLVEPEVRQEVIRKMAEQAVKRIPAGKSGAHGKVILSPALLEQVSNLVEHPVAILGNFDSAYLDLPREVLVTCMEHHQKFFPLENASGSKLLPHFIGIRNGISVHQEIVREGYERVLAARLADARFFYDQDLRVGMSSRVEGLKGVIFQEKLGTLFDKVQRMHALVGAIDIPGATWRPQAQTAALLCKADLTTAMVGEFPELQGIMGRLYGELGALESPVSRALEEHYWPITLSGKLPSDDVSAAVALTDKIDTLAGDFAIGLIPSGSADPYGLRRAAVGILRILEDRKWPVGVVDLIDEALKTYPATITSSRPSTKNELAQFMRQRFAALLEERGYKPDEIDAVLAGGIGIVADALARLEALHQIRKRKEFEPLAVVFKRADNIIRKAALPQGQPQVFTERFKEDCERELYRVMEESRVDIQRMLIDKKYREALERMAVLREPLDQFFNKVMVNDQDVAIRENRYSMLRIVTGFFRDIADFSKLQNA